MKKWKQTLETLTPKKAQEIDPNPKKERQSRLTHISEAAPINIFINRRTQKKRFASHKLIIPSWETKKRLKTVSPTPKIIKSNI
jgi:hypothetical protein